MRGMRKTKVRKVDRKRVRSYKFKDVVNNRELDGVGPVDNRHSID